MDKQGLTCRECKGLSTKDILANRPAGLALGDIVCGSDSGQELAFAGLYAKFGAGTVHIASAPNTGPLPEDLLRRPAVSGFPHVRGGLSFCAEGGGA